MRIVKSNKTVKASEEPTGFWKVRMTYYDDKGHKQNYNAYTTGSTKSEAKQNVFDELSNDEQDDTVDAVVSITEEEYNKGYSEFHDGERSLKDYSVEACGTVKASKNLSANEQALTHIRAAIDILGKSGQKDDITKDSIANLATVMFDIKGNE